MEQRDFELDSKSETYNKNMMKFIHSLNDDLYEKAQLMDQLDTLANNMPHKSVDFLNRAQTCLMIWISTLPLTSSSVATCKTKMTVWMTKPLSPKMTLKPNWMLFRADKGVFPPKPGRISTACTWRAGACGIFPCGMALFPREPRLLYGCDRKPLIRYFYEEVVPRADLSMIEMGLQREK